MSFLQSLNILATTHLGNPLRQAAFTAYSLTFNRIADSLTPQTQKVKENMPPEIHLLFSEKFCHCSTSGQVPQGMSRFCNFILNSIFSLLFQKI